MSNVFQQHVEGLKFEVVNNFLHNKNFTNIKRRLEFYSGNPLAKPPKESCLIKTKRVLIEKTPNPYHYDYSIIKNNRQFEDIVSMIKEKFGYTVRGASTTRKLDYCSSSRKDCVSEISNSNVQKLKLTFSKNQIFPLSTSLSSSAVL